MPVLGSEMEGGPAAKCGRLNVCALLNQCLDGSVRRGDLLVGAVVFRDGMHSLESRERDVITFVDLEALQDSPHATGSADRGSRVRVAGRECEQRQAGRDAEVEAALELVERLLA